MKQSRRNRRHNPSIRKIRDIVYGTDFEKMTSDVTKYELAVEDSVTERMRLIDRIDTLTAAQKLLIRAELKEATYDGIDIIRKAENV